MSQNDFSRLHKAQLEIMDEIHRICVAEGITYYLVNGSALGAVRHGGFIPWDIDIDCAMPRSDYARFKIACEKHLNSRFRYYDYKSIKNYTRPHALVGIAGTKLYFKYDKYNKEYFNYGIYVDVFPLDAAPNTKQERIKHTKRINKAKKRIYEKRHYNYSASRIKKFGKWIRSLKYVWISIDKLNEKLDIEMRRYENVSTDFLCSMADRHPYENECSHKDWFGTPKLVRFENRQFFIPQEADKYLRKMYGDYMQLPPESERKANLSYFERAVFDKEYE